MGGIGSGTSKSGGSNMTMTVGSKMQPQEDPVVAKSSKDKGKASKGDAATPGADNKTWSPDVDPNQAHETLEMPKNVNVPQARFGHTITVVNKYKVVLFGGAMGDTGKYSMTGETFIFNMFLKTWNELSGKCHTFI